MVKIIICIVWLLSVETVFANEFKDFSAIGKLDMETYPTVYNLSEKSGDYSNLKIVDKYLDGAIDGIIVVLGDQCKKSVTSKDIRSFLFGMNNDGYGKKFDLKTAVFFAVVYVCDINLSEKLTINSAFAKKESQ